MIKTCCWCKRECLASCAIEEGHLCCRCYIRAFRFIECEWCKNIKVSFSRWKKQGKICWCCCKRWDFDFGKCDKCCKYGRVAIPKRRKRNFSVCRDCAPCIVSENLFLDLYAKQVSVAKAPSLLDGEDISIEYLLEALGPKGSRNRTLMEMRFGLGEYVNPATLESVGRFAGISREDVRQIQIRSLEKMRQRLSAMKWNGVRAPSS